VEESCEGEEDYEDYGGGVGGVVAVWDPGGWVVEGWVVGWGGHFGTISFELWVEKVMGFYCVEWKVCNELNIVESVLILLMKLYTTTLCFSQISEAQWSIRYTVVYTSPSPALAPWFSSRQLRS
jgi:hypothetical protein